ncbi:MAG: hypothetical protein K0U52_02110 [Gammaproteobacteria bacterium]|nr:hypothetical protein [Gammaproteobacteria bacterium]
MDNSDYWFLHSLVEQGYINVSEASRFTLQQIRNIIGQYTDRATTPIEQFWIRILNMWFPQVNQPSNNWMFECLGKRQDVDIRLVITDA